MQALEDCMTDVVIRIQCAAELPVDTAQECLPLWLEAAGWKMATASDAVAAAMGTWSKQGKQQPAGSSCSTRDGQVRVYGSFVSIEHRYRYNVGLRVAPALLSHWLVGRRLRPAEHRIGKFTFRAPTAWQTYERFCCGCGAVLLCPELKVGILPSAPAYPSSPGIHPHSQVVSGGPRAAMWLCKVVQQLQQLAANRAFGEALP